MATAVRVGREGILREDVEKVSERVDCEGDLGLWII